MSHKLKLPPFTYLVTAWAKKVGIILESAEIDIKDAAKRKEIAPLIFARLPEAVLNVIPRSEPLPKVLEFLLSYDDDKPSVTSVLAKTWETGSKPSLFYRSLIEDLQKALPAGTPAAAAEVLAWTRLKEALPDHMTPALALQDPDKAPSAEVLRRIDLAVMNSTSATHVVAAASTHLTAQTNQNALLEALVTRVDDLATSLKQVQTEMTGLHARTQVQPNKQPRFQNDPIKCFSCGNTGHSARECSNNNRPRQGVPQPRAFGAGSANCFKCRQPGHLARDCTQQAINDAQPASTSTSSAWCPNHRRYGRATRVCHPPCSYRLNW